MSKPSRSKPHTFVFLGISGSGKGVQARLLLAAVPRSSNISTGDYFRRVAQKNTLIGRYTRGVLRRGDLLPYWAAAHVWLSDFFEKLSGDEDVVFDGAPRRLEEARMLDDVMRDIGRALPVAIYLRLSRREALARLLKRRRFDDRESAIRERFRFFQRDVLPVVNYYRKRRRLFTINGEQPIPAVWRDIRKALHLQ